MPPVDGTVYNVIDMDRLSNYEYHLPARLIANEPCETRDKARLLVVDRATGELFHHTVRDLPELLRAGDCLVLNDTQVIPARLFGRRNTTGGKWEGLYLGCTPAGGWRLIGQTRGKLRCGEQIAVFPAHHPDSGETLRLTLLEKETDGVWIAQSETEGDPLELLKRFGTVPLPPYIRRKLATDTDWRRYQTTFARRPGAIAAPTAGLHFTPELLAACGDRGVRVCYVTLHVGIGTFCPVTTEKLSEHCMHSEWCELPAETAELLRTTKEHGGRIVAVGTTTVRTLESASSAGRLRAWRGETNLFIRPDYRFRSVDCLLTNFHLPRSTLLVLVSAFAGTELVKKAYACAIQEAYRFYSYGDAMLLL